MPLKQEAESIRQLLKEDFEPNSVFGSLHVQVHFISSSLENESHQSESLLAGPEINSQITL